MTHPLERSTIRLSEGRLATLPAVASRLACGGALVAMLGTAAVSGIVPWPVLALSTGALVGGLCLPLLTVPWVLAVLPWGERLAAVPVRATEAVLAAFFAGWCLRLWASDRRAPRMGTAGVAAVCLGGLVLGSWVRVSLWTRVALPLDFLVTAGRDPHTAAAAHLLLGLATFLWLRGAARGNPTLARHVLTSTACSGMLAAVATVVAVPVVYWLTGDYNEIDRYIGATPSRGAFHLVDVNAAGSQYILAGLVSLALPVAATARMGAPWARAAQTAWWVGRAALVVALWMSGSRAAGVAGSLMCLAWLVVSARPAVARRVQALRPRVLGVAAIVVLTAMTMSARLGSTAAPVGSPSRSLSVRGEFLDTSLRMIQTAPLAGVGIGTYYQRSGEFMPPTLRALYGRENAHNYFMQVWAELGVVGLAAFLWCLGAALGAIWGAAGQHGHRSLAFGAFVACAAYLLTCVTGHPFLVVQVAIPFWAVLAVGPFADDAPPVV